MNAHLFTRFTSTLFLTLLTSHAAAQVRFDIVAVSGDTAPDGNGTFSSFNRPALNDAGQVAFHADLTGTSGSTSDNTGIFLGDGITGPTQIVRAGQAAPDANGTFSFLGNPLLNDAGQAAFLAGLTGTRGGGTNDSGIFRGDGATGPTQIARAGQAAPDTNGIFDSFIRLPSPALNNAGQVVFAGLLTGTSSGSSDNSGIFRGDGLTGPTQIARAGQAAPDANGTFSFLGGLSLNDAGQVGFNGQLIGTSGGNSDNRGIFRGDGVSGLTQIARAGQAAPDANGTFRDFGGSVLNDAGQAAFDGLLIGTSGGLSDDRGIFRRDGVTGLTQIARAGQAAPDSNGNFSNLRSPALNDEGQVAFVGGLTGTSGGFSDDSGIFRGDGVSGLTQIAREGQAAPDANGTFTSFGNIVALNDAGQAAFGGILIGTSGGPSDDEGIFLFDDLLGLVQIAREGDDLLGSTITRLFFTAVVSGEESSGFNELGQVAFAFSLADGRSGIAIASVIPEPTGLALAATVVMGVAARRRRLAG